MTARDSQTSQALALTGLQLTLTAPTANNDVVDTGRVFLVVDNTSGASITVTVHSTQTVKGLSVENLVVTVPTAKTELIGPLPQDLFGQATGTADENRAYVDYSAVSGVTRAVVSY